MRTILRLALCCCILAGGAVAQRGGGGYRGGGGMGGGGFRGGGGMGGGGFRGGGGGGFTHGGFGGFRGGGFTHGGFTHGGFGGGFRHGFGGVGFRSGFGRSISFGGFYGAYYSPYIYNSFGYYPSSFDYGYGYPYASSAYDYGYQPYQPASNVVVVYPQQSQSQPVYVERVQPALHEYDEFGQELRPRGAASDSPALYLIAFQNHEIRAAIAYWVNGSTLHYVTQQHEEKQAPLDSVDRELSFRLNRERRVSFSLAVPK